MTTQTKLCLCGKPATHTAYIPINVWAGLQQMTEAHRVCNYHASKARAQGYKVVNEGEYQT